MRKITQIIIHCSASRTMVTAATIKKLHVEQNKWKDIGYHYVITPTGTIEFGRPESTAGAHAEGVNANSIGVCLGGLDDFPERQMIALVHCVRSLMTKHKLTTNSVFCHYEVDNKGKTCPNIPGDVLRMLIKGESEWNLT